MGVPAEVLADRMGCLKGGVVAGVVVPTAAYVRFAAHYGFRPDFRRPTTPSRRGPWRRWSGWPSRTWPCRLRTSVATWRSRTPRRGRGVPRSTPGCTPRRHLTAADLVEQLYRGLADNSVSRVIDTLLRHELIIVDEIGFAPLDDTGTQLLFRFVAAAYERRALGVASHWPFEQWGRFLPEHVTATSLLDRLLHHATVVVTEGESFRMREARTRTGRSRP